MFSVIIPLYNKAQSITATLKSVLAQTFPDFEIVLVNDGSTDESLKVAKEIRDARIRIIDKENGGVSSARNRGIREAKNDWIAFLDGDDLWTEDHLDEYYKAIQSSTDLNWLFSGYTSKNGSKSYQFVYKSHGKLENIFDDLLKNIKIHTSTVCVKKELFVENPELYFTEGINNSEDREVWYKLCLLDKSPFYIAKSLSIYYTDISHSLTKNNSNLDFLFLKDNLKNSKLFGNISERDQKNLIYYLTNFNKKALKRRFLKGELLQNYYSTHFTKMELLMLKFAKICPKFIRKIILKLC